MLQFITTCKGRLCHAKRALPSLLAQPNSDVIFVDWGCPDRSSDWAYSLHRADSPDKVTKPPGKIVKAGEEEGKFFNLSAARNLGAYNAKPGDILCFIDCDVIAKPNLSEEILKNIKPGVFLTFQPRGLPTDGTCVVTYEDYMTVAGDYGGYDETFSSYGNEDADFYDALRFAGIKEKHLPVSLVEHIEHEKDQFRYELLLTSCENQMYRRLKWELATRRHKVLTGQERYVLYQACIQRFKTQETPLPEEPTSPPKVSFCTTCKGREWQLRATYKKNIEDNLAYGNVEFVLLNYDSPGDIDDFVKEDLQKYIDDGVLKYYSIKTPDNSTPWHACVAKNTAHRLATGDIVCNLDADNMTKPNFASLLAKLSKPGMALRLQGQRGAGGMIALWKRDFLALGGYDESFLPMGHQDNDLEDRMWAAGIEVTLARAMPHSVIPNTDIDRMKYVKDVANWDEIPKKLAGFVGKKSYAVMAEKNRKRRERNKQLGRIAVNEFGFAPAKLLKNFTHEVFLESKNPDLVLALSDINLLYKGDVDSKPLDVRPDGCWFFVHKDWRDPLFLKPNGEFYRPCNDNGHWKSTSHRISILWDNWAPETLGMGEDGIIRGRNMRAMRLGDWEDGGKPKAILPMDAWAEIFEPWRGKKAAYLQMYGNVGDQMIYDAAKQMMSHFGISYEPWHESCKVDVLMISGGGNLGLASQVHRRKKVIEWATKRGVKCIILPQTLFDKTFEKFPEAVDVYAREAVTANKLKRKTKIMPDLALGYQADFALPKAIFKKGIFCSRETHKQQHICDPTKMCHTPEGYIAFASLFEEIITNRLHFAIAGLIAGRKVTLFPNEYYKNRAVWEAHLKDVGCGWVDEVKEEDVPKDDVVAELADFICYGKRVPSTDMSPIDIYVFGVQRSGNHGVIRWLLGQFKHLNPNHNLRKAGIFKNDYNNSGHNKNFIPDDSVIPRRDKVRLISYENDWNILDKSKRDELLKPDAKVRKVCFLVLRNPLNWFASSTKWCKKSPKSKIVDLVASYFENFYLESKDDRVIPVLFDRWLVDPAYRAEIARNVTDEPNDKFFGSMDMFSCPSSFDGWKFKSDPEAMKLLERYKELSVFDNMALSSNHRIARILKALGHED